MRILLLIIIVAIILFGGDYITASTVAANHDRGMIDIGIFVVVAIIVGIIVNRD